MRTFVDRTIRRFLRDVKAESQFIFFRECKHNSRFSMTKSANYTMTLADSGKRTYIDTDGVVITLPATVAGVTYEFVNAGADAAVGFNVSPGAVDLIQGCDITPLDNKDLINTKATAKKGDLLRIVGDGTNGWMIQDLHGTWAREA